MYRYSGMLPFKPPRSLGEGGTPLISVRDSGIEVLFKLEYLNPSGSFKDRGTSLAVGYAYMAGYRRVVEDTSGNTGISVALYSRLYGLKTRIYMPRKAPEGKKRIIKLLGADIVEAPDRGTASKMIVKDLEESYYVAHTWSPFYIIGPATISYEVYEENGVPDVVIIPVGSGGLFLGIMRGFEVLKELGLTNKVPKPIIVEGYSICPVYRKIFGDCKPREPSTLADGIMVPQPPRLGDIIDMITRYNGEIVLVGNSDIKTALRDLIDYGFLVEPTSAATWSGFRKIKDRLRGRTVLLPLTGSGLKTADELYKIISGDPAGRGPT